MSETNGAKLAAALVVAQRAAQAVGKDATNAFHKYKYASSEAIIEEARGALNGAGLTVLTTSWSLVPLATTEESAQQALVRVTYRILHESGESMDCPTESYVVPEKGRPWDKAHAGALTTSLAYFLRGLLLLPREDEETAVDRRDDRNYEPQRRPLPPRPTPAPAPAPAPAAAPTPAADPPPLTAEALVKMIEANRNTEGGRKLCSQAITRATPSLSLPDRAKIRAAFNAAFIAPSADEMREAGI